MNNHYLKKIKHSTLSNYPTTIRRSVCVLDTISIDHSVNKPMYQQWIDTHSEDQELKKLHNDMAVEIIDLLKRPNLQINFIHLDPRIKNHRRSNYY